MCVSVHARKGEIVCRREGFGADVGFPLRPLFKETQVILEGQNNRMEKDVQCCITPSVWLDFTSHTQPVH